MSAIINNIEIIKAKSTKINDVDFDNLKFGSVFSDHMLVCNYENGKWQAP
ncbi:branched-chain amino acid aminotransferase [Algibacter lectus]|nr:branched-chain amino acid aminotransferase [Algibacter lectus]